MSGDGIVNWRLSGAGLNLRIRQDVIFRDSPLGWGEDRRSRVYQGAIGRSWFSAWDWATGQGIFLTWAFAVGVVVCAVLYAVFRAHRKHHSWGDAMSDAKEAIRDFVLAAIGATVFLLFYL
jgi:hypothetical protein